MRIFLGILALCFYANLLNEKDKEKACFYTNALMADIAALVAVTIIYMVR